MWTAKGEITGVRAGKSIPLSIVAQPFDSGKLVFDHFSFKHCMQQNKQCIYFNDFAQCQLKPPFCLTLYFTGNDYLYGGQHQQSVLGSTRKNNKDFIILLLWEIKYILAQVDILSTKILVCDHFSFILMVVSVYQI